LESSLKKLSESLSNIIINNINVYLLRLTFRLERGVTKRQFEIGQVTARHGRQFGAQAIMFCGPPDAKTRGKQQNQNNKNRNHTQQQYDDHVVGLSRIIHYILTER